MTFSQSNPASGMFDVVDFFERVDRKNGGDGLVWVKATAARGAQVIVELQTQQGKRIKIPAIRPGDPVCLSKFATFDVIRDSADLMQCATSGLIRLMSNDEANEHFNKKANVLKTTPEALKRKAEADVVAETRKRQTPQTQADPNQRITPDFVSIEDVVNPRLHHLCAQVQPALKPDQRMPVNELMSEILDLEESLSMDDLIYLQAQGYYPTVKKWAETKQRELAQKLGLYPETDELSDQLSAIIQA